MSWLGVKGKKIVSSVAASVSLLWVVGSAHVSSAVTVHLDFEDPPYTAANLVGQDGWAINDYASVGNGTTTVSSTAPLAGSQSVLYNRTFTGGGFSAGDVGQASVGFAKEDGTPAADLTASVLLQADANSVGNGQLGLFLGYNAFLGASPVFVLLSNANSSLGTGDILVSNGPADDLADFGDYHGGDVVEFTLGIDLDNGLFDVFVRNVTAGTPAAQLPGPAPGSKFRFIFGAAGWEDIGDGMTHRVDVGLALRNGAGRVDGVTLEGLVPEPATFGLALLVGLAAAVLFRPARPCCPGRCST